jgi:predicted transcriptional regulator
MPYPGRPVLKTLPQFVDSNVIKPTPEQRAALLAFVAEQYQAGRSLRELAEQTGRTQTAVRRALDEAGVPRRSRGAYRVNSDHSRAPKPAEPLWEDEAMPKLPQPLLEVARRHPGEEGKIHYRVRKADGSTGHLITRAGDALYEVLEQRLAAIR